MALEKETALFNTVRLSHPGYRRKRSGSRTTAAGAAREELTGEAADEDDFENGA
jgi:hypothetical protein